jgi:ABC-type uncharacterized transport system permease subunit
MSAVLDQIVQIGFLAAILRIATPLALATLGEMFSERAGVLNLGIEGIMTFGAMIGWLSVYHGTDLWTGLLIAALAGGVFGLLHSVLTVTLGLSQHVSGLGMTLFASSFSYYVFRLIVPVAGTPPTVTPFQPIAIPGLSTVPFVGPAFFSETPPTYLAIMIALVIAYIVFRTPIGLAIRMTGENPHAAEAQGIDPIRVRYGAVIVGSALMGMGGAFLTLSAFNSFFPTMVQGRGWICIALVVFASWRPGRALFGALLFAFFDAFQLRLQTAVQGVPYQTFLMTPYILSIIALAIMSRRARVPQALMQPYRLGER